MRIKSYYAQTIPEAMERARVELGDDAMIIASNRTSGDTQRLGAYEVVFGVADQGSAIEKPALAPRTAASPHPQPTAGLVRLKDRMEDLRKSCLEQTRAGLCSEGHQPGEGHQRSQDLIDSRSDRFSQGACG